MSTAAWIITAAVLAYAAGSVAVCLTAHRDRPAAATGMPHAVRETTAWLRGHLPHSTPTRTRKHRRTR